MINGTKKYRGRPPVETEAIKVRLRQPTLDALKSLIDAGMFPSSQDAVRDLLERAVSQLQDMAPPMENQTIEDLQRRCDQLEDLVNGLCTFLAIQSKNNDWENVDVDDEGVKELLRPMLTRERRLQKSGVMAADGFYAGQALVRIQQVKDKLS